MVKTEDSFWSLRKAKPDVQFAWSFPRVRGKPESKDYDRSMVKSILEDSGIIPGRI